MAIIKKSTNSNSRRGTEETNLTRNPEVEGSIPGLTQWVEDLALLWLWCRPSATAPIGPLAWKPLCAVGAALKKAKNQEKKKKSTNNKYWRSSHCGTRETNPTRNHEDVGLIPGLIQWVKDIALP